MEQLNIVMEYADGGTMEKLIQERNGCPLGQDLVLYYFTQITLAMHYIHSLKILHRDLKTQNVFLNRKRTIVKVGDFGISKELNSKDVASTVIGTANYLSPEICEGGNYWCLDYMQICIIRRIQFKNWSKKWGFPLNFCFMFAINDSALQVVPMTLNPTFGLWAAYYTNWSSCTRRTTVTPFRQSCSRLHE